LLVFLNHRDAPSVGDQPEVVVLSWRVLQAANGDRHLLAIVATGSLRMTSALASFNAAQCTLTTQSGRRYKLCGPPEAGQVQLGLLHVYALRSGLAEAVDVSDELWAMTGHGGTELPA
jgi:hypothetical protein